MEGRKSIPVKATKEEENGLKARPVGTVTEGGKVKKVWWGALFNE